MTPLRAWLALDGGRGPVEVLLADRVRWDPRITGGADRKRIDLSGGLIDGVALDAAAGLDQLTVSGI